MVDRGDRPTGQSAVDDEDMDLSSPPLPSIAGFKIYRQGQELDDEEGLLAPSTFQSTHLTFSYTAARDAVFGYEDAKRLESVSPYLRLPSTLFIIYQIEHKLFSHRRPSQSSVPSTSVFNSPRTLAAVTSPKQTPGMKLASGIPHFKLDSAAHLTPFLDTEIALDGTTPLQPNDEREFTLPPAKIAVIGEEHVSTFDDEAEINLTKLDRTPSI